MRKFYAILTMLLLAVFIASNAYAGSADARTASFGQGIAQVNGVGDLSTGNTAEVDANGSIQTKEFTKSVVVNAGDQDDACTGAAVVYAVILSGANTTALDWVILQDAATVATPTEANTKLEVSIGTAGNTAEITIPGGLAFTTGVSVNAGGTNAGLVISTVVYSSY